MGSVLLGLGLLATLKVTAEGACPTAAAVEARLQPLLPQLAQQQDMPRVHAHIEPLDELLRVEVRSEDGALLSVRDLQRAAPCADLAAAAAVVIASALLSAPRAPPQVALPPPPPRPPAPPLPVARPAPAVDVGGAVALAAVGSGVTVAGTLLLHAAPSQRAVGVRLGLTAAALRSEALGEAAVVWTRAQLELGPRYRLRPGRLLVDLHAHAAAALVYAAGQGYVADYRNLGWDVGLGAGLRVGLPRGRAMPWVGVAATGYLRPQELVVIGLAEAGTLPRFDVLLALGCSAGQWR